MGTLSSRGRVPDSMWSDLPKDMEEAGGSARMNAGFPGSCPGFFLGPLLGPGLWELIYSAPELS